MKKQKLSVTHEEQQNIWEQEHAAPAVLLQMDSKQGSSGVVKFWEWLRALGQSQHLKGLEMGCGKGRNCMWLAQQGADITGFDFSTTAIAEANRRARQAGVGPRTHFLVQDAVKPWDFLTGKFDFVIDCFATTDIESVVGRTFAAREAARVLKPGGYLLMYTLSINDQFHKEMGFVAQLPLTNHNSPLPQLLGSHHVTLWPTQLKHAI